MVVVSAACGVPHPSSSLAGVELLLHSTFTSLISHTLTPTEVRFSELNEAVLVLNVSMCSEKLGYENRRKE